MSILAADAVIVVGVMTTAVSLIAALFTGYTAWYAAKRKGDSDDRQLAVEAVGLSQSHAAVLTERAQAVLMQTIDTMKAEMVRQDAEHEERIAVLVEQHRRDVAGFQAQIDALREDHHDCMKRNDALQRELAELRE